MALLALCLPASAASKTVRDWTGTCDDVACFAEVTGSSGLAMGGQGYRLQIHRSNDPSAAWYVKLVARKVAAPEGAASFAIDGTSIPTQLAADQSGEGFDVSDQASLEQIFPLLRTGNGLDISYGASSEAFSLSGIAAVLLWIDDQQNRVGNSGQVAAIAASGTGGGAPAGLREELTALSVVRECQWFISGEGAEAFNVEQHDLGDSQTLLIVQCTMGAYQPSTLVFLRAFDRLDPLAFPITARHWLGRHDLSRFCSNSIPRPRNSATTPNRAASAIAARLRVTAGRAMISNCSNTAIAVAMTMNPSTMTAKSPSSRLSIKRSEEEPLWPTF